MPSVSKPHSEPLVPLVLAAIEGGYSCSADARCGACVGCDGLAALATLVDAPAPITTGSGQTTVAVANAISRLRLVTQEDWEAFAALGILEQRIQSLEEQLEAAQAELTEWRTSIATERLTAQLEASHEALRRIADGSDYTWGNIARLALEGIEVDPNEPSDGRDLRGGVLP